MAPGGLDAKFPFWVGSTQKSRMHFIICSSTPIPDYGTYIYFFRFKAHFVFLPLLMTRWIRDPGNEVDYRREREKRKGSQTSEQQWSTYCHSSINPLFSPSAPHPPCLPGLKAAAVFVWSAKTLLPLLAFHQGCMWGRRWDGRPGGCLSGWGSFL